MFDWDCVFQPMVGSNLLSINLWKSQRIKRCTTLPATNIALENGWLEYYLLLSFWDGQFSGAMLVSRRAIATISNYCSQMLFYPQKIGWYSNLGSLKKKTSQLAFPAPKQLSIEEEVAQAAPGFPRPRNVVMCHPFRMGESDTNWFSPMTKTMSSWSFWSPNISGNFCKRRYENP